MVRVLMVHNYYQHPGGEDTTFHAESALLRRYGHDIIEYTDSNERINTMSKLTVAKEMIWSSASEKKLHDVIKTVQPDVVHFYNTFIMISPAVYHLCKKLKLPVVRTVQNYRYSCVNALLFRDNQVCEACLTSKLPWAGVVHACYRESHVQSLGVLSMLATHKLLGTWQTKIDRFITVTEFMRTKLVEGGLPAEKIVVKPNFSDLQKPARSIIGDYALFVGRLSAEKGVMTLLEAWKHLPHVPLVVVGDGPLGDEMKAFIDQNMLHQVKLAGWKSRDEVTEYMQRARFLVQPSVCYEGFPLTIVESYGCGLPVIASKLGSMAEVVLDGQTGLHFQSGNARDLAEKVKWAWSNETAIMQMGHQAHDLFYKHYTPEKNYKLLTEIYEDVIQN